MRVCPSEISARAHSRLCRSRVPREAREAEAVRRRLHNMVQELKGNIRVFCRVRPVLPSDLPSGPLASSSGSAKGGARSEDTEQARDEAMAAIVYPDKRDHREIVLSASSESATGQERKEMWNFTFDRVQNCLCREIRVSDANTDIGIRAP